MNITKLNIIYEDEYLVVINKDYNQEVILDNLYPLNNLSKEVSGLVVFSKSDNIEYKVKCSYLGIAQGYLDDSLLDCRIIKKHEKYSIIEYTSFSNDTILRENLMNIKHPIIGDYKYKSTMNPITRICIHLYKIEINNKTIYSKLPDSFKIFMT